MKLRYTFKGLLVVITVVALLVAYFVRIAKQDDEDAKFHKTMGLVHKAAIWICSEYWCDERVPDKLDLRALSNKYEREQKIGPLLDPRGKELHVKTFNNGTIALVYSEAGNRKDELGEGDDISCFACMIHTYPGNCTCSINHDRKEATHFAWICAGINPGCNKTISAQANGQTLGP